jgi:hypothetical protein
MLLIELECNQILRNDANLRTDLNGVQGLFAFKWVETPLSCRLSSFWRLNILSLHTYGRVRFGKCGMAIKGQEQKRTFLRHSVLLGEGTRCLVVWFLLVFYFGFLSVI